MKATALVVSLALAGCVEHPVATIASATTVIGFGGCAVDEVKVGDCALIGAISGVFFGGLAWLLYHYTDTNAHELRMDESIGSNGALRLHTFTPPPPVPVVPVAVPADAGVPDAPPPVIDAPGSAAQPGMP